MTEVMARIGVCALLFMMGAAEMVRMVRTRTVMVRRGLFGSDRVAKDIQPAAYAVMLAVLTLVAGMGVAGVVQALWLL